MELEQNPKLGTIFHEPMVLLELLSQMVQPNSGFGWNLDPSLFRNPNCIFTNHFDIEVAIWKNSVTNRV
ncbi:MAG: hypothetical protein EBQ78_00330, partial [Betaproteobacteria bacterium]|nr:hypothetical protein [Betaproteobacteria bacterium]